MHNTHVCCVYTQHTHVCSVHTRHDNKWQLFEQQTNRFSTNLAERPGFLPYNTPLNDTYPGTFIQIPQKVVGHFFDKLKIQKLQNPKIQKLENPKIQKSEKLKI